MEDVTRKRIMRMLERLPEEQLYQVLDYIEFLEVKYARAAGREPDALQRFAERVEDQMRVRSIAPRARVFPHPECTAAPDLTLETGEGYLAARMRTTLNLTRNRGR